MIVDFYVTCIKTEVMIFFFNVVCALLSEQNLKRLRDINEEIQKLRMVNSQRGSREVQY